MKTKSYAKLNLNLNVLPQRMANGLFKVHFINCQISLYDILNIKASDKINISCDNKIIPVDDSNLVYKTCQLLNIKANIHISKNIPMTGGLAGGSTNAASTIFALNKIYKLNLTQKDIDKIANKLGKDVCYLVYGGLAEVSYDGSVIDKIPYTLPRLYLLIVYPSATKPSTAWMYQHLNINQIGKDTSKLQKLKKAIKEKNKINIVSNLHNDFETLAINKFPELLRIKKDLAQNNAINSILLGSGLGMAGFYTNKSARDKAYQKLKTHYNKIFRSHTL